MRMIAEGVRTTGLRWGSGAPRYRAADHREMAAVLDGRRSPAEAVDVLMGRKQRAEADR